MNSLKYLLIIIFLTVFAYSCNPEELPEDTASKDQVTAGTGDQSEDFKDPQRDKSDKKNDESD